MVKLFCAVTGSTRECRGAFGNIRFTTEGTAGPSDGLGMGFYKKCRNMEWTGSDAGGDRVTVLGSEHR